MSKPISAVELALVYALAALYTYFYFRPSGLPFLIGGSNGDAPDVRERIRSYAD